MNRKTLVFSQRGFTLIEMLVVLAIMGVILSVTVNGQRAFDSSVVLSNTAYDVALSIRQAQTYGVSGRVAKGKQTTSTYGYGVDVQSFPTDKYVLFADTYPHTNTNPNRNIFNCHTAVSSLISAPDTKTGDCMYTKGADVKIQSIAINNRVSISGACVYKNKNLSTYCSFGTNPLAQVDISFTRPDPGAIIIARKATGGAFTNGNNILRFNHVCIRLSSGKGNRYIMVNQVGIISVISNLAAKDSCPGL